MVGQLIVTKSLALLQQAAPPDAGALTPEQFRQQIALEAVRNGGHGPNTAVAILVPLAFFAFIALLVWLGSRRKRAQIEAQAELQKQLLAKFNSGQELSEFLQSEGGQRFLDQLSSPSAGSKGRILQSLRTGIVLAVLGLGVLVLSLTRAQHGLLVPAVILLALGLGFLLSTAVSYRLTSKWEQNQKVGPPPAPLS
jgi:hypothetical protein